MKINLFMSGVMSGVGGMVLMFWLASYIEASIPTPKTIVHCPQYHHSEAHQIVNDNVVATHIWCVKNIPKENYGV